MYVFSNVRQVYTGASGGKESLLEKQDILIKDGVIQDVLPHDAQAEYGNYQKFDCSNYYLSPGLIDCHSHISLVGLGSNDIERSNTQANFYYIEKALYKTLVDGGVTTIRDIGGATDFIKRMVDQGILIGPRMKISIAVLSSTGGHIDFCGPDRCHGDVSPVFKPGPGRPSSIVDGPLECRKRVRELAACGADFVKICTSSGVASPNDSFSHEDLGVDEIAAICDEARKRGMYVAAHAHTKKGIKMAIMAGVKDIQHISFLDDEVGNLAHKHNCIVTPTSWIIREYNQIKNISPFVKEKLEMVAASHKQAVQAAYRSGLDILAGTDPFLPGMHGNNFMEIAALVAEGLPPLVAWYGATGLAAKHINLQDSGIIAPGKRADMLIHSCDVVNHPEKFKKETLLEVLKDGVAHKGLFPQIEKNTFEKNISKFLPDNLTGSDTLKIPT